MASSSSSSSRPRTWRYRVFTSFHGPDVRKAFLSHLRKQFSCNGISMFDDQRIERSQTIAPALSQAIRQSRISIVVLSKNYASSGWCLDELVEIFKCKEEIGQIVMTIFYQVDPSHVRKQTGDFGKVFKETCALKTKEESERWSQALNDVGNIAGEHFLNWDNESKMIEKIARDVSNKLNTTISWDFEDMVGIKAHLRKMQSLLHLDNEDEAMIVGISGPAGIGKTTIARALHSRLCSSFQLTCIMENLRGSCNSDLDEYGLKLCLQAQLLSKILNLNGIRIDHLRAIPERLCDQKVLIILDDVDDLQQLEALADEPSWFGPGSRIIVTTEDQELLEQHGIDNTYRVEFPTNEEARKIFRRYAFRRNLAPFGFEKLVERVIELCDNLPLGLRVMGSTLRGKREDDWESLLHRLENSLDRKIKGVLRVGYDNLHKDDQLIYLLIAFFFNYEDDDYVMAMLSESNLDVRFGLKTLAYKSLIQKSTEGKIVMHKLLQQVGKEAIQLQEPTKRQIITDAQDICDVLENDSVSRSVMGITFDISKIPHSICISAKALKRMPNLRFINIYKTRRDTNVRLHVPEDIYFPPSLRLLRWEVYPAKCLPRTFMPEYLVELKMGNNELEKLWEGTQLLTNLKKLKLTGSYNLKELPDLSNATNLDRLDLNFCQSLVEIPSSIGNLQKLECLDIGFCSKLQVVPLSNLASLDTLGMTGCWQLRKFPDISTNLTELAVADTMLEDLPESIRLSSRLETLRIHGSVFSVIGWRVEDNLRRSGADIERIPVWIKDLQGLKWLHITGCPKLASIPELPRSLIGMTVDTCESLETISLPFDSKPRILYIANCFKLSPRARRAITQPSIFAYLPGREIPAEFIHRAIGNSLIVRSSASRFRICAVVSTIQEMGSSSFSFLCRIRINGCSIEKNIFEKLSRIESEHLFIFPYEFPNKDGWALEHDNDVIFEFSNPSQEVSIIECGVQILTDETDTSSSSYGSYEDMDENLSDWSYESCSEQVFEDSSSTPRTWTYHVFLSFHRPDVQTPFLIHLHKHFNNNGISSEGGQTTAPALTQAIGESRISMVVFSKNYASSSWSLDELVEIFKCKKDRGQIVMTVFYGVDPSDVQKQTGDFGEVFKKTCARKTKEERRKWSQALEDVGKIPGEHFLNWDDESRMVEKIARDVSNKLNATISKDFEDMVGIEAHLEKLQSFLHLDDEDEAMIVGICGPAGIGKTTIARALHCRLSSSFQLTCFMENISGSYPIGLDEYGLKRRLQEQFLSKILNQVYQYDIKLLNSHAIPELRFDQKVLIILDDVDDLQQLEALAKETNWFGPGSRVIITSEDKELLEQHCVSCIYRVDFPDEEEARQMFCRYAFNQSSAPAGFEKLVERVTKVCTTLPMGLRVMGSSLLKRKGQDWEYILHKLETSLDLKMEGVLRVGYDILHKDNQFLFLLIAFFFNYKDENHVMAMLSESNLDVRFGLKTLANKSLIHISNKGKIVMHKLLQQVGREAVKRQDHGMHKILINADEICDVLENDSGTTSVRDIYFDISTISNDVYISAGAFRKMCNLQFLSIYNTRDDTDTNVKVHVPEDMDFPPSLRLLRWEAYPGKCLPRTFMPEYLASLVLRHSKLEKLWEGIQRLTNLKKMDLYWSLDLKELPDLSNATNLERLDLAGCKSLVELPSSIGELHKLQMLRMDLCINLQVVRTLFNLASLQSVFMLRCRKLRKIPDFYRNITSLVISDTMLEELPESTSYWSHLQSLSIYGSIDPYPMLTEEPCLEGSGADIETLPDWIKDLHGLTWLFVGGCPKLASLPELPRSLTTLEVDTCESLETLESFFPLDSQIKFIKFPNCFKLGEEEARSVITNQSLEALLPGRTMPEEFNHRATGNLLIIPSYFCKFRVCLVVSPKQQANVGFVDLFCYVRINGCPAHGNMVKKLRVPSIRAEHLFIFPYELLDEDKDGWFKVEQENEMAFHFVTSSQDMEVIECGVQNLDVP